ncbi:MAG: DUF1275 domain-containing protein [Sphingobacteriaceae bacterium]|nr:MAG: DUF1275 domain-containing protein [Sphingobacteriaceae bacterium]
MLRKLKEERTLKDNLLLASSTAFVAGMTNVAGVIAFLSFTSNITGHVAMLAQKIVNKEHHDIAVFSLWLMMFLIGAFMANFITKSYSKKGSYRAHSVPVFLEIVILFIVAVYGHNYYTETKTEREFIIGAMLFSMGLQFYFIPLILLSILYYDISELILHRIVKVLTYPFRRKKHTNPHFHGSETHNN